MKVTPEFLLYLRNKAESVRMSAAYNGSYSDGGASHQNELICAFEAGRDGKIPSFWVDELRRFESEKNEEYKTYLRLKKKFEGT